MIQPQAAGVFIGVVLCAAVESASGVEPTRQPISLRDWMTGTVEAAFKDRDLETLESAFSVLASRQPPGFPNWAAIAQEGAERSAAGDLRGARRQCMSCHMRYQRRYRSTHRGDPFP